MLNTNGLKIPCSKPPHEKFRYLDIENRGSNLIEFVEKRIEKLRNTLAKKKLDAFLVLIEENRRYLSGYAGEDTQFDESAGALLIAADRSATRSL